MGLVLRETETNPLLLLSFCLPLLESGVDIPGLCRA